jgi:hypothetical protein
MEEINNQECIELKNIKYKTMLLSGVPLIETKSSTDQTNIDKFLENEKNTNKNGPWCKLDKTIKIQKIFLYVEQYKKENSLDKDEEESLIKFLKDCLDRKKLQRVKDVVYDKTTGLIKDIPILSYNKQNRHFTLKNIDKRVSTVKSLSSKKTTTIKNKNNQVQCNEDSSSDTEN